jgi:CHAT domain/Ternary complex associated domain 7
MARIERSSGLVVDLPETLSVGEMARPAPPTRRRASPGDPAVPHTAATAAAETDVVLAALSEQELELVDALPLRPRDTGAGAPGRRRRAPAPSPATVELRLPVEANERAVVLLEQDGVYHWKLPDETVHPERPRRRGVQPVAEPGVVTFRIELRPTPGGAQQRGLLSHVVAGAVRVFVLKFAGHAVVGNVLGYLERNIRTGLIEMTAKDPTKWRAVEPADVKLPKRRPARILLFVHGTFSSTVGAFGGLGSHDFLDNALKHYDAVLGFDHRTLSLDPLENATALMGLLRALKTSEAPAIDVITHSRGGLVTRSLIELLLPFEREWHPRIDHVVFVAATNGGTRLAEPDNWHSFVDLYTNVALAGTRALGLIPQAQPFAVIAGGVIRGVGALVKYLIDEVVTDKAAPGLAAMEPDGDFVRKINEAQPGQPDPKQSNYFAVTSNFEPRGSGEGPREMPPALLMLLADGFVDRLFHTSNDLVVDVESMSAIDPAAGGFIDDAFDFGNNRRVYHCNYFVRPETNAALQQWLELAEPSRSGHRRVSVGTNTNFIEVDPDANVGEVTDAIESTEPDYVVIRRPRSEGGYAYAFSRDEVLDATRARSPDVSVRASLELGEHRASDQRGGPSWAGPAGSSEFPTTERTVVFAGTEPTGVEAEPRPVPSMEELETAAAPPPPPPPPAAARATRSRPRSAERPRARAARRAPRPPRPVAANGGGTARRTSAPRPRRAPATTPHIYADMPPEVRVGETVSVHVEISAQELARATGATARGGTLADAFDASKPLIVQVLARTNFEVVGDDRETVDAPGADDPSVELFFDVVATHASTGEVWVTVRQGAPPLLTLVLNPEISDAGTTRGPRSRAATRADSVLPATVPVGWSIPTLRVNERVSGQETYYDYELDLLEGGAYKYSSSPIKGDRDAYVNGIYRYLEETWVRTKGDLKDFRDEVRAYGGELFDELFPGDLQARLWKHRSRLKNVRVLSTEPFIPWELVHLKNPSTGRLPGTTNFLAQMGLVRWLWNQPGAPVQLQIREGKAWYVVPEYPDPRYKLIETATEATFLSDMFGAKAVVPQRPRVMAVLTKRNKVDLFHFAGHGGATGGDVEDARILLQGRRDPQTNDYVTDELSARRIYQEANLADPDAPIRPLVVLNACQAGRAGIQLTSIGGFAEAFIHAGAGAFVSSLWSVGDEPAATFTTEFYTRLKAGKTIADAVVSAREKARAANDATWLAYVVYAHPDARLA